MAEIPAVPTTGRYDHPNFQVVHERAFDGAVAGQTSLVDFAHFRSRNKCVVTAVTVHCSSLPSAATSWSLQVMRGATTIGAYTVTSFSVVGDLSATITLVSSNTLTSAGHSISLEMDGTEKGKFDVLYEYRLLPA